MYTTVLRLSRTVDNGPGIPRSDLEALRSGTGTQLRHVSGLGLCLVKWILAGPNASVQFERNEPRGTAVVMAFSAVDPTDERSVPPASGRFDLAEVGSNDD